MKRTDYVAGKKAKQLGGMEPPDIIAPFYKLVGREAVPCGAEEFAAQIANVDERRVAYTEINGVSVSTVFLCMNHNIGSTPLIFETLVNGTIEEGMWRWSSYAEAEEGHRVIVERIRNEELR